ncbi:MAG: magnesium transporter, partial [Thermovirga sp.]|nr:magnesium transporter [Thermovirga sp.]
TLVSDLMDDNPVFVTTLTDQEKVAQVMSRYDLHVIPVVDLENRLVGIVTFDDVLDIVEEEATEDFERMAGIQPFEEKYLEIGLFTLARKRLTWLLVCIITQAFTSSILKHHESIISSVVALTFFIPFLIDTGGNTGTQSSTLMIRGMTLGEIKWGDIGGVLLREAFTGLILGVALALLGVFRAVTLGTGLDVALVVALSLVVVVIIGNLIGVLLPFAARALRFDPAIVSGPFITTVVDVVGLLVYFQIARSVLGLG